ncbi:hypothetical protein PM082_021532 [Marasmius tenuissimus]|nr:hypothetical protein PM082_021532 [Marasmius tenuissimus]
MENTPQGTSSADPNDADWLRNLSTPPLSLDPSWIPDLNELLASINNPEAGAPPLPNSNQVSEVQPFLQDTTPAPSPFHYPPLHVPVLSSASPRVCAHVPSLVGSNTSSPQPSASQDPSCANMIVPNSALLESSSTSNVHIPGFWDPYGGLHFLSPLVPNASRMSPPALRDFEHSNVLANILAPNSQLQSGGTTSAHINALWGPHASAYTPDLWRTTTSSRHVLMHNPEPRDPVGDVHTRNYPHSIGTDTHLQMPLALHAGSHVLSPPDITTVLQQEANSLESAPTLMESTPIDRTHITLHILTSHLNGPPNLETHALVPLAMSISQVAYNWQGRAHLQAVSLHAVLASIMLSNNSTFKQMTAALHPSCLLLHTLTELLEAAENMDTLASFFHAGRGYRQLHDWNSLDPATAESSADMQQLQALNEQDPRTAEFIEQRESGLLPTLQGATHFLLVAEEIQRPNVPRLPLTLSFHSSTSSHMDWTQFVTAGALTAPASNQSTIARSPHTSSQSSVDSSPSSTASADRSTAPSSPTVVSDQSVIVSSLHTTNDQSSSSLPAHGYFEQCPLPPRSPLVQTVACRATDTPAALNLTSAQLPEIFNIMEIQHKKPFTDFPHHERTPTMILNTFEYAYDVLYRLGGFKATEMKNIIDGCNYTLSDGKRLTTIQVLEDVLGWSGVGKASRNYTDREHNLRWAEHCSRKLWRCSVGTTDQFYNVHKKIVAFFSWRRKGHKCAPDPSSFDPQERLASALLLGHCQNYKMMMKQRLEDVEDS